MSSPTGKHSPVRDRRTQTSKDVVCILLSFIALLLLASTFLSISFIVQRSRRGVTQQQIGSTFTELVGTKDAISCKEIRRRVARGQWIDPNHGKVLYRRELVTQPSFSIALHSESYDPVRWEHFYVQGKYYEDWVHARFLQILRRENDEKRQYHTTTPDGRPINTIPLVVDIGANIGYYTLLSMALGYSVLAFEINPPNLLRLCESLELNDWNLPEKDRGNNNQQPNVRFYQQGVSDVDGQDLEVWVPKNPGQAFMKMDGAQSPESANEQSTQHKQHDHTSTITLDRYALRHGWLLALSDGSLGVNPNIVVKILKVDVEGKEAHVIEGAQAFLRSGIVENILIEFRRLSRPNVQQALLLLLDSGFTLVHDTEGKVSETRSAEILSDLTEQLKETSKTVDLWFQRV